MTTAESLLVRALHRQEVPRPPVWLMRQAGRHLPEYLQLRERHPDFLAMIQNPQATTEAALQPLRRYPLDAAIVFSDILVLPQALDVGIHFRPDHGPAASSPLDGAGDFDALPLDDPERTAGRAGYLPEAVAHLRAGLDAEGRTDTPVIGFVGAPWTLFTYMVRVRRDRQLDARSLAARHPQATARLLEHLARAGGILLAQQAKAGADAVQIFDTWAGELDPQGFRRLALGPCRVLIETYRQQGGEAPVILFARGCHDKLEALCVSGAEALGLDWRASLAAAAERAHGRVALQGNLDPAVLATDVGCVREAAARMLAEAPRRGYVANLGHGIPPNASPECVAALVEALQAAQ